MSKFPLAQNKESIEKATGNEKVGKFCASIFHVAKQKETKRDQLKQKEHQQERKTGKNHT